MKNIQIAKEIINFMKVNDVYEISIKDIKDWATETYKLYNTTYNNMIIAIKLALRYNKIYNKSLAMYK
ncbi:hypothetical protein [Clostridium beijerinckii]|uniref:hypothetical protein n=1 Tax=Clostridium beijerinckii TaxID=1520 RepID=UPI001570CCDD|nr:hypothetical protein [Clostridium beijerinckii]NRU52515.1 hypothetical protein [Clostridium beijerinckii]NYC69394.1 hypothetical protein [Clostridium beijerinckii]NYC91716.1 hypothetical protein [Clostridium beijerinckii]